MSLPPLPYEAVPPSSPRVDEIPVAGPSRLTYTPPYTPIYETSPLPSESTQSLLSPFRPRYGQRRISATSFDSQNSFESRYPTPLVSADKLPSDTNPSDWKIERGEPLGEADDYLHNPNPKFDRSEDSRGSVLTLRGISNIGFLILIGIALLGLFAGYPVLEEILSSQPTKLGGHNIGGINSTGQVPAMTNHYALVDPDTPESALYYTSYKDGSKWELQFSDEFNVDGRSFYPGDDPYWEAVDLHYWATGDMETERDKAWACIMTSRKQHLQTNYYLKE